MSTSNGTLKLAANPWFVISNSPDRFANSKSGSSGSPSAKVSSVSATLMTCDPFGRNPCSKEIKVWRLISVTRSLSKSRPRSISP